MSNSPQIAAALHAFARRGVEKSAMKADPETADAGDGVTRSMKKDIPKDSAVDSLKDGLPKDQPANEAQVPSGSPDRMTAEDGNAPLTSEKKEIPKDPSEPALTKDLPSDESHVNKEASAAKRIAALRNAISGRGAAPAAPEQNKSAATPAKAGETPAAEAFDTDTLVKLASEALATEEGVAFFSDMLEKKAGRAAADERIREAIACANAHQDDVQIKAAAFDYGMDVARRAYAEIEELGVTEAECGEVLKQASVHEAALDELDHPMLKRAYAAGVDDAAAMDVADETGGDPEAALAEEGGQLGEEELLMVLQDLIDSGQASPEEVAEALAGLEAEAGAAEGAPPEAAAAPPEAAPTGV